MKPGGPKNIVASIQGRLVQQSHELDVEHQLTLVRFGGERLLYRLSESEFADRFILKGAALLLLWLGEAIRPTKDIDLLGLGDTSAEALKRIFVVLCEVHAPEDGLTFVAESVRVEAIREGQEYGGMRVTLMAMLGKVRILLQVDSAVSSTSPLSVRCDARARGGFQMSGEIGASRRRPSEQASYMGQRRPWMRAIGGAFCRQPNHPGRAAVVFLPTSQSLT